MNLCHPDNTKSCAACCGLYNVPIATKEALGERLALRTSLFSDIDRSPDAIQSFERYIIAIEGEECLDSEIHVCRFVGFLDPLCRTVGCLLHPSAQGNAGQDWRGLCYYGSLACKTFYCDAWHAIPHRYLTIVSNFIHDWHLWGLVVTDAEFVICLLSLLETALQATLDPALLRNDSVKDMMISMLRWKDEWPFANGSAQRRSRYYHRPRKSPFSLNGADAISVLVESIEFTFGSATKPHGASELIRTKLEDFVKMYWSAK